MELIHSFRLELKKQATTAATAFHAGAYPLRSYSFCAFSIAQYVFPI
jgi:hypothetical protein